jgi:hypothetical protein
MPCPSTHTVPASAGAQGATIPLEPAPGPAFVEHVVADELDELVALAELVVAVVPELLVVAWLEVVVPEACELLVVPPPAPPLPACSELSPVTT